MTDMPLQAGAGGPASTATPRRSSVDVWRWFGRYGALAVLVGMIVIVAILEPSTFATKDNVINILNQSALTAIVAMGVTFPLVAGEFDLSVGNTASLAGVVACTLMQKHGFSIPEAFVVTLAVGAIIGLVNGLVVTVIGVNALVATLGIGTIVIGINYAIASGLPVTITGDNANSFIDVTLNKFLGIPYPVYVMAFLGLVLWVVLNRTVAGQAMQAVAQTRYCVILLDLRLPDGSGLELLRRLRDKAEMVPVIILSAYDQISDQIEGLRIGAVDYLVKPFNLGELITRIRRTIGASTEVRHHQLFATLVLPGTNLLRE